MWDTTSWLPHSHYVIHVLISPSSPLFVSSRQGLAGCLQSPACPATPLAQDRPSCSQFCAWPNPMSEPTTQSTCPILTSCGCSVTFRLNVNHVKVPLFVGFAGEPFYVAMLCRNCKVQFFLITAVSVERLRGRHRVN